MREMMEECKNALHEYLSIMKKLNKNDLDIAWHDIYMLDKWRLHGQGAPCWYLTSDLYYESGYGEQHLYGLIVFLDGTYLRRREYDGKEWWEHITTPKIPNTLPITSKLTTWDDKMYDHIASMIN